MLNIDTMIPLGLIITEIISNIFKYAFPGNRDGKIKIEFKSTGNDELILVISDDGIGLPADIDLSNSNTLGLQLIYSLSEQLKGKVKVTNESGTCFEITFREMQ